MGHSGIGQLWPGNLNGGVNDNLNGSLNGRNIKMYFVVTGVADNLGADLESTRISSKEASCQSGHEEEKVYKRFSTSLVNFQAAIPNLLPAIPHLLPRSC